MFEKNNRYITKGVNEEIETQLQIAMWNLIEQLMKKEDFKIDYLQIFKLRVNTDITEFNQEITHSQEVEPYTKMYLFTAATPVNTKIFVIDSNEYSTMLL